MTAIIIIIIFATLLALAYWLLSVPCGARRNGDHEPARGHPPDCNHEEDSPIIGMVAMNRTEEAGVWKWCPC